MKDSVLQMYVKLSALRYVSKRNHARTHTAYICVHIEQGEKTSYRFAC